MEIRNFLGNVLQAVKSNSPEIMTAFGITGVISTGYLAAKGAYRASEVINQHEMHAGIHEDPKERFKERARETWKLYIPAVASGAVTVGCIILATRSNAKRTTAAVAAYSLTEKAFSEYREKVVEQIGKNKEQALRDGIAQERVTNNPPGTKELVILGGEVTCCELHTGRYFKSQMEVLRRAQNDINLRVNNQLYVTLDEFYDLIGLSDTTESSKVGWDSDKLMDLEFSTVLTPGGEPCLAFSYNYVKPVF